MLKIANLGTNFIASTGNILLLKKLKEMLRRVDVMFALCVLFIIGVLIFPVSPLLLDCLLSASIAIAVLILMTVLFIDQPLDFSSFPSILLVITMLRLSLNVSTTRLILSNGHRGTDAAGHVVEAFGYFVMQGSVVIGTIVFTILTIINFIVITKGSGRIAEVAARFSLDSMPGKQMAIDAELAAGMLNEEQAKGKRKHLEDESTFFGAMDGANKFVRGDAIAGLLITFINFIAGIVIGTIQKGMSFDKALHTYTILTIGDGLVSQIPSLLVSISAGLLVTKSGVPGSADKAILQQISKYPKALAISSLLSFFMVLMPGTPATPFTLAGIIMALSAYYLSKAQNKELIESPIAPKTVTEQQQLERLSPEQRLAQSLKMDIIKLELGYELLPLVDSNKGGLKLIDQIKSLRKQMAKDMGFLIPSIRIQDNVQLKANAYKIKIKEIEMGSGTVQMNKLLAMAPNGGMVTLPGEDTTEPAFGLMARWINISDREEATFKGYTVVEPATVIITHLTEVLKENMIELLTYTETQKLLDSLTPEQKKLVADIIPGQISIVVLQRVLQNLLSESVSIRDLPTILEAVSEISSSTANIARLTEHVRFRLAKQICHSNANDKGYIPILVLSPAWEQVFTESIVGEGDNKQLAMQPTKLQEFVNSVNVEFEKQAIRGEIPVILTSAHLRPFVRSVIERVRPSTVVMSQNEVYPRAKIKTLGQI